jgi:hypothetical protein
MYVIAARASGCNEDHMAGYFPLVMGKAPLLWLDNLPAECITSWATLPRLFTTNYQVTYNRPGNTHHLARVRMRSDETLCEYTNRYFENRNTLAGVKDDDVIAYYKKGITNIKLFEKIHEADAKTIGDLMTYVDKLVDTQDAVMHDFNGDDHDDRGTRSRKRSGEAYVADPPRPSTFLEGDFNMVMDDQCQFHRDAKHTMRECEQLKRALGVPSTSKKTRSNSNDDRNGGQRFDNRNRRPDRRDYRDRRPYPRNDDRDRRDYRRDDRRDDYRRDDRTNRRDRSDRRDDRHDDHHNDQRDDRHRQDDHNRQDSNRKERTPPPPPKGGNPNDAFQKANREINFIVGGRQAIKRNRQTRSNAREIGHVNTENPRPLRWSEFPITFSRKDHWVHIPDPETYPLVVNPIVNSAWLPKTLIDGGSSLNIIFIETLHKMEFDFSKMTACDEPFYGVVPGKVAYPIGRVCLPVTFGTEENFRTEYLTFEVADFRSSYHAIFGRPMLAKFMAIPHHTYLIMKMSAPNGILFVLEEIMVSYNCKSTTVELSKDSAIKAATTVMVAQAAKIDQTTLQVPKQKRTSTALDPSPAIKKVCLGLPDASKEVVIGADLNPK